MKTISLMQTIQKLLAEVKIEEHHNDILKEEINIAQERKDALKAVRSAELEYNKFLDRKFDHERFNNSKHKAAKKLANEIENFRSLDPNVAKALFRDGTITLPRPEHLEKKERKQLEDAIETTETSVEQSAENVQTQKREVPFKKEIKSTEGKWESWEDDAKKFYTKKAGEERVGFSVGPGEVSVMEEFGAKVMGSSYDFDILQNSKRWEVKEIDGDRLRTSIHGIVASAEPRFRLNVIFKKIDNTIKKLLEDVDVLSKLDDNSREATEDLTKFISAEMESIFSKSEITKKKLVHIVGALDNAAILYNGLQNLADKGSSGYNAVTVGKKTYSVRASQFQKILQALGAEDDIEIGEVDEISKRSARYVNLLEDDALKNPTAFMQELADNLTPDKTFKNVEGVILVTPEKYLIMTMSELNDALDFDGLTQGGRSFYKVKNSAKSKK